MSEASLQSIDLLKIDIEGAEKEVFEHSSPWIDRVNVIMAELHEDISPGCIHSFSTATKDFQKTESKGETVVRLRE